MSLGRKLILLAALTPAIYAQKPSFTVGWSVYVGWNPYDYMAKSGILKKWADKYGVNIKVQALRLRTLSGCICREEYRRVRDDQYGSAGYACGGRASIPSAIIVGDYSNGNDAVITRGGLTLAQIPGKQVLIVEKTVSQYLIERGMAMNGLEAQIKKMKYLNTSDADIASAFLTNPSKQVVVTWKPMVSQIAKAKDVKIVIQFVADSGRNFGFAGGADGYFEAPRWR